MYRSWADEDIVARELRAGESTSPGRDRRNRTRGRNSAGRKDWGPIMAGVVVAVAVAIFLGGVVLGVIAVVAIAIRREDRRYTLAVDAPDRLSRSTRGLTGVDRRHLDQEFLRPVGQLVH
jgi:hypothetical protein